MVELSSLKGMYDRYPPEWAAYRALVDVVEETAAEFGFREIDAPSVERTDLYRVKSGDELLDQTYSFEDRGGREVTLIPEQTPTRARLVQQRKDLKTPIKWYDTSKRWRYEQVQKGRDREFLQTDVDVFGVESVEADAEVVACAATIFRKLGVADRVEFLVNDRTLLEAVLDAHGVDDQEAVMRVVDDKEKMDTAEFRRNLRETGLSREKAAEVDALTDVRGPIVDTVEELAAEAPDDERTAAAVERMEDLAAALETYGVADVCRLDLSVVRGLAYYTGLVFEAFDTEGDLRALFGGGRYDDLVGLFGGQEVPAVGFGFGYSTTALLLQDAGEWPAEAVSTDVYVLSVSGDVRETALEFAMGLREEGLVVETDLADRSVGSQFGYADTINAAHVVVVGSNDLANDEVTVRDMDSGEEDLVPVDRLVGEVTARVRGN
ncbi:MAG: histidine--tRNA ligase [Halobacteriaceae archaeon]